MLVDVVPFGGSTLLCGEGIGSIFLRSGAGESRTIFGNVSVRHIRGPIGKGPHGWQSLGSPATATKGFDSHQSTEFLRPWHLIHKTSLLSCDFQKMNCGVLVPDVNDTRSPPSDACSKICMTYSLTAAEKRPMTMEIHPYYSVLFCYILLNS